MGIEGHGGVGGNRSKVERWQAQEESAILIEAVSTTSKPLRPKTGRKNINEVEVVKGCENEEEPRNKRVEQRDSSVAMALSMVLLLVILTLLHLVVLLQGRSF